MIYSNLFLQAPAKLDAIHGYFQLALENESSLLTMFLLPTGRYRYLRAPMGLSSSSDEWCRQSDWAIEGNCRPHSGLGLSIIDVLFRNTPFLPTIILFLVCIL